MRSRTRGWCADLDRTTRWNCQSCENSSVYARARRARIDEDIRDNGRGDRLAGCLECLSSWLAYTNHQWNDWTEGTDWKRYVWHGNPTSRVMNCTCSSASICLTKNGSSL